ncbi:MAG TPA: carbamoyltransferase C-terminal domain-containing protein [Longimicrobiaceae bacterium]
MPRILGFGGSGHDWSCCLLDADGSVLSVDEAALTRLKYGIGADLLRSRAREACVAAGGLDAAMVDHAVACDLVPLPLAAPFRRRLTRIRHHLAHAYAAFFASPFTRAAVLVADNGGSPMERNTGVEGRTRLIETVSTWRGREGRIEPLSTISGAHVLEVSRASGYYQRGETDNSLGHLYAVVSEELGFVFAGKRGGVTEDGKTMALASFGDDRFMGELSPFLSLCDDGGLEIRLADGSFRECVRALLDRGSDALEERWARQAAVARAAQVLLERAMVHLAADLRRRSGEESLALAGGVALNCVANARIAREAGFRDVFVLPAAGDHGTALGSALYGRIALAGAPPPTDLNRRLPFLGPHYPAAAVAEALDAARAAGAEPVSSPDPLASVAEALASGRVVAWFEGRLEFGPRALGHRSILAAPTSEAMRDRINVAVKRRERFRPFAPVVLERAVDEYFDVPSAAASTLPYMLVVARARPERREWIPAVVHVDGSARLQVLTPERYPTLTRLVEAFAMRTGIPVLLNTSFNLAGEPIVASPLDAVDCFLRSGADLLYLDGHLVEQPRHAASAGGEA